MPTADQARPIAHESELVDWFRAGHKPVADHRVGIEHEKIGVLADGSPVPYFGDNGIERLLAAYEARGWKPKKEGDHTISLERPDGSNITLEPGGQFEMSDAPRADLDAIARRLDQDMLELAELSRPLGLTWLGIGLRPFDGFEAIPWVPKGRYVVMREYLPTRGKLWREMMQRTATVQANVDYIDEADAAAKLRAAFSVTSLVTALYANSPLREGKESGFLSYRGASWLDMDPDRCGLLPFAFEDGPIFQRYTDWALDVPMFFVRRGDNFMPARGTSFRSFLRDGFAGERATIADWELHLSTLFPEVRLKRYVEVRGSDNGPLSLVRALPALWMGLLYDDDAMRAATALTAGLSMEEREQLRSDVTRMGLRARVGQHTAQELSRELVAIAAAGLTAREVPPEERALLEPLAEIAASGRTRAELLLDVARSSNFDRRAIIDFLKY
ncbi:MAG: glutamate--cysteine ligase [Deltaproteobacteria bacterium]|nr:glutamate--cysteine ligase [Deltaproteobacteria bacterium]